MTASRQATFHIALTVFWIVAILPTIIWWKDSILWVAFMSLWANIASHIAAWQAVRAEIKIDEKESA
jgi:hypothetical protein